MHSVIWLTSDRLVWLEAAHTKAATADAGAHVGRQHHVHGVSSQAALLHPPAALKPAICSEAIRLDGGYHQKSSATLPLLAAPHAPVPHRYGEWDRSCTRQVLTGCGNRDQQHRRLVMRRPRRPGLVSGAIRDDRNLFDDSMLYAFVGAGEAMREASGASARVGSLDGLRGVAALVVVVNHVMVTGVTFARVADRSGRAAPLSFEWWFSYTPLHLFWGGTEAVFIFFILSGYVLTGPTLKSGFSWLVYYPKRLLRLYLPVWASLCLAALTSLIVVRHVVPGGSWWVNAHGPLDVSSALVSAMLLGPIDFLNNPLWSLAWEMWFSLLLPFYIVICQWGAKTVSRTIAVLALLGATMAAGSFADSNALRYLPMFALGVLIYLHRDRFNKVSERIGDRQWVYAAALTAGILLLTSYWIAQAHPLFPGAIVSAGRIAQVAGAVLFVLLAIYWSSARAFLTTPAIRWLGQISFSLYLTHDAVVISTTLLLGGQPPVWVTLLIALPVALLLAEVFFRLVEKPSHELAKLVGARIQIRQDRHAQEICMEQDTMKSRVGG